MHLATLINSFYNEKIYHPSCMYPPITIELEIPLFLWLPKICTLWCILSYFVVPGQTKIQWSQSLTSSPRSGKQWSIICFIKYVSKRIGLFGF